MEKPIINYDKQECITSLIHDMNNDNDDLSKNLSINYERHKMLMEKSKDVIKGISEEMTEITNSKFAYWDWTVENNILESGTEDQISELYSRLKDPTIYAYAFFKNPKDPKKRLKLYPYQDIIINDKHKRVMFVAANQIGKSITLCVKALVFALHNPGTITLMISKTMPQSKDLLRQIRSFLRYSTLDYEFDIGDTENKTEVSFRHFDEVEKFDKDLQETFIVQKQLPESRIVCVPATEAALGYAADLALEDELGFYEDGEYFHYQILEPRTFTTKGQIVAFSNPNGQQGIFWKLFNDPAYHKYNFNFLDCPTNTEEEFISISRGKTVERVDSTLLAIFTSPEGSFLTLDERNDMQEERPSMIPSVITQPVYIFFDWAKTQDRTVRIIATPKRTNEGDWADEVFVYEMKEYPHGTSYKYIIEEDLKNTIVSIGPQNVAMVGWDNTGVGKGLEDFMVRVEDLGVQAMPVEFSIQNKSRIYTLFKLLAENRRIKIPHIDECDKQLSMLRFKTTSRGYLQVHHENERDRDDFPDALAGVCSLMISPDNPPVTCEII